MADKHRVVILGGGFGGLYAAKALKRAPVEITLVDRRNFHLFQPLLYQVATGSLSPGEISAPIRSVLSAQKNTAVLLGDAVDLDPAGRRVRLSDGASVPYDSLICATGSQGSYFGHDEWHRWAPGLKTIEDATAIRHKLLFAFEAAERLHDNLEERRTWLTFVIVGAGATGVELAGALGEIANETLRHDFRFIKPEEAKILVLDSSPRVLPTYPEYLSRKAENALLRLSVRVRSNIRVVGVDGDGVDYELDQNGQMTKGRIQSHTVIWAAGVTVSPFTRVLAERTGAETDRQGRIKVNPDLTIPNYRSIYVIGDSAYVVDAKGKPLPGVAQVAMHQGGYAARAIVARLDKPAELKPFKYFDKGDLAVIGRGSAVANVFGFQLSGFPAWLIWLFIHLMYIVEFQSRILVFVQWGFLYLTSNRGAMLITGHAATDILQSNQPMKSPVD
ncbi:MAG: NAD(P)/FAD-dependent oxidoreductase [Bryobacteraceae bacterium]